MGQEEPEPKRQRGVLPCSGCWLKKAVRSIGTLPYASLPPRWWSDSIEATPAKLTASSGR